MSLLSYRMLANLIEAGSLLDTREDAVKEELVETEGSIVHARMTDE
jgi:hypothetical protein